MNNLLPKPEGINGHEIWANACNLNLLFNKLYYSDPNTSEEKLAKINKGICDAPFQVDEQDECALKDSSCFSSFYMKTTYPGLLMGIGYSHETEKATNTAVKLGFSFDYVTGQPYIPGSSVKGVLRSVFHDPAVIKEILTTLFVDRKDEINANGAIQKIESAIFGRSIDTASNDDVPGGQDVFLDAVISCGDKDKHVLGMDNIAPHGDKDDVTTEPNPIQFLKVRPNVILDFRFLLHDSTIDGTLSFTKKDKEKLFRTLIELFGVGAKTNVGYGNLVPVTNDDVRSRIRSQSEAGQSNRQRAMEQNEQQSANRQNDQQTTNRQNDQQSANRRNGQQASVSFTGIIDKIEQRRFVYIKYKQSRNGETIERTGIVEDSMAPLLLQKYEDRTVRVTLAGGNIQIGGTRYPKLRIIEDQ